MENYMVNMQGIIGDKTETKGFVPEAETKPASRITPERLQKAWNTLIEYKSGKSRLEQRIIHAEQWWKQRHWEYMQEQGAQGDIRTASAWLFNVIISKHADGVQSCPEANILPREEGDKQTAKMLSSIIPCVLEQNDWDSVYSDVLWQKLKGGTGMYGVFWDKNKLNGLGDIAIKRINLLHLFWEPGVSDIQDSQNVFHVEPVDRELLKSQYPQLDGEALNKPIAMSKFKTEDKSREDDKTYVVDWYYHSYAGGRRVLHYCKFVGSTVLYATEDTPELAERGLYDHGMYPFVADALFPVEGSPCGFGYIDVCKAPQEQIDIMNQAIVRHTLATAAPRFFVRSDGSVNEEEFADFTKPLVHVTGTLGADSIMPINVPPLDGNCVAVIENKIGELKETSGNTDSSNGITQNSSQAASAIAALQEASGKVSRDSTLSAYRAFCKIVNQLIELIRQFYDIPRQFRIVGEAGGEQFVSFDNNSMQPQPQGMDFGIDMGYRLPVFDVKVTAQTKSMYSRNSQNELATTLYQMGVFNPEMAEQAMLLLDMMEFDGKDALLQKVAQNGMMLRQLAMYQQIALELATRYEPQLAEQLAAGVTGGDAAGDMQGAEQGEQQEDRKQVNKLPEKKGEGGRGGSETKMRKARERAQQHSQVGA